VRRSAAWHTAEGKQAAAEQFIKLPTGQTAHPYMGYRQCPAPPSVGVRVCFDHVHTLSIVFTAGDPPTPHAVSGLFVWYIPSERHIQIPSY
jgi:hypothetical protein